MPTLVPYNRVFLDKSWEWLNDLEIKKLTLTPDFSREQQAAFFASLPTKSDYWIQGVAEGERPIGAMGLKRIDLVKLTAEYWGYIGEREFWSKGIGKFLLAEAIAKGKALGLTTIYLKVGTSNDRAKRLYVKTGFSLEQSGPVELYRLKL